MANIPPPINDYEVRAATPTPIERIEPGTILNAMRTKMPPLTLKELNPALVEKVKTKVEFLLGGYPDSPEKKLVTDAITNVIATGCVCFGIDPVNLIMLPMELNDNAIGTVNSQKIGPMVIHNFFMNPSEIMFRVNLLQQFGCETGQNITNILFVIAHEMAHLGQFLHAEQEYWQSKFFTYSDMPTEIQADEAAQDYCKSLLAQCESLENRTDRDNVLLAGLPITIQEARERGRPRL